METRTYDIVLGNRDRVEAALVALNKRAARKALPLLAWTWGKVTKHTRGKHPVTEEPIVHFTIALSIPVEVPKYQGWTFVATLEHLTDDEGRKANILHAVPGEDVPVRFRDAAPYCDHCRSLRRRADTYVLRHESGNIVQVGSTCLQDFLGTDEAGRLAGRAEMLSGLGELIGMGENEEGFGGGGGGYSNTYSMEEYLGYVAWCVRVQGWLARSAARDEGCRSTADSAWVYMVFPDDRRKANCEPTAEDKQMGMDALDWAAGISDERVNNEKGDYLHNLRTIARNGYVTGRNAGIAASTVTTYQRFLGDEIKRQQRAARPIRNEYVGEVGKPFDAKNVMLDFVTGYESEYGYVTVLKFLTEAGETLVWKTNSDVKLERQDCGKFYDISGKVKKHEMYKDRKQTCLTRCDVTDEAERAERAARLAQALAEKAAKKEAAKAARKAERAAKKAQSTPAS